MPDAAPVINATFSSKRRGSFTLCSCDWAGPGTEAGPNLARSQVATASRAEIRGAARVPTGRASITVRPSMDGRVGGNGMTRHRIGFVLAAAVAALSCAFAGGTASAVTTTTKNLIKNGGAEKAAGSPDGSVVPVPGWTETTGATFTAVQYGASGGFPTATSPGPSSRGVNFFAGGPSDPDNTIVAVQTVTIGTYKTAIDGGNVSASLVGWLGGFSTQGDQAFVEVDFKNAHGTFLSSMSIGPVTEADRAGVTGLKKQIASALVPVKARTAFVQLSLTRVDGSYNDGYADALSLKLSGV
jgi:hypothetical protein